MKKYFLLSMVMCFLGFAEAQFVIPERANAEKLTKRKLMVAMLDDENDNRRLNEYLKTTITDMWKYGAVEFINDPLDIPEKVAGKKSEYAVMYFSSGSASILGWATVGNSRELGINGSQTNVRTYAMTERFHTSFFSMRVSLPDKEMEVIEVGVPTSKIDSTDIVFFAQQLRLLIDASLSGEDILALGKTFSQFEKKKLYINEADLTAKGIETLKKNTKHDFEFLNAAEFKKLVLDKAQEGCYVKVIYCQEMKRNVIAAVEIKTGRVYSRVGHLGADCKSVFSGKQGTALDMSFMGICPKMIAEGLYLEAEQNRRYNF
jgi:hypothetical protein